MLAVCFTWMPSPPQWLIVVSLLSYVLPPLICGCPPLHRTPFLKTKRRGEELRLPEEVSCVINASGQRASPLVLDPGQSIDVGQRDGDSFDRELRPAPPCTALVRVADCKLRPALPCHHSCSSRSGGAKETCLIACCAPPPLAPLLFASPRQREGHLFDRELRPPPPATALVCVAGRVEFDRALRPPQGDLFDFVTRLITSCDGRGRGERAGGGKQDDGRGGLTRRGEHTKSVRGGGAGSARVGRDLPAVTQRPLLRRDGRMPTRG